MKLLVTGATGFLGTRAVSGLVSDGHEVSALVRKESCVTSLDRSVRVLIHDGSTSSIADSVAAVCPDVAVHIASYFVAQHKPGDITSLIGSNVLFGAQLLDALAAVGTTALVNFGTSWQHFHTDESERDTYRPASLYAATKQAFEDIASYYADAHGVRMLTLKLSDTYGPDDPRNKLVAALTLSARTGGEIELSPGDQTFNLAHVNDVVEAIRVAISRVWTSPRGSIEFFAVRGTENMTLRSFVDLFGEVAQSHPKVRFGARSYRDREVMRPWLGDTLPGWEARIPLRVGLMNLFSRGYVDRP